MTYDLVNQWEQTRFHFQAFILQMTVCVYIDAYILCINLYLIFYIEILKYILLIESFYIYKRYLMFNYCYYDKSLCEKN